MKKKRKKKKEVQNLNWATARLHIKSGSRYSHCIVTPRLENWPSNGIKGSQYNYCIVTKGLAWGIVYCNTLTVL